MITISEFVYLANRSAQVFLALMKGHGMREAAKNRNLCQRALVAYAKKYHGNGRIDIVQQRMMGHLAELDKKLWRAFKARQCNYKKFMRGDSLVPICERHGEKMWCRKEFEDWSAKQNY